MNPNLPVGGSDIEPVAPGTLTVAYEAQLFHAEAPDVSVLTLDHGLRLDFGLTEWLGVQGRYGGRVVRVHPEGGHAHEGEPAPPPTDGDLHHRHETLVGPTDPWLVLRAAFELSPLTLSARAGASFPVGSYEPNPFALEASGRRHQHIQLGSGAVVPILGAGLTYAGDGYAVGLTGNAHLSLFENPRGYRAPTRLAAGLRATTPLGTERWRFHAAAELWRETSERWSETPEHLLHVEGNLGRTSFVVGGGVGFAFAPPFRLDAALAVPVLTDVEGKQFTYSPIVQLALVTELDLAPEARAPLRVPPRPESEHDHDHDHEHEHAPPHDHEHPERGARHN